MLGFCVIQIDIYNNQYSATPVHIINVNVIFKEFYHIYQFSPIMQHSKIYLNFFTNINYELNHMLPSTLIVFAQNPQK